MVKTGYISFTTESGGGQDEDGNPTPTIKVDSEFIECNLSTVTHEYRFIVDGDYVKSNYSIYIDQDIAYSLVPSVELQNVNSVKIKDNNSNMIGTYRVNNIDYLNLTKRVKIEV